MMETKNKPPTLEGRIRKLARAYKREEGLIYSPTFDKFIAEIQTACLESVEQARREGYEQGYRDKLQLHLAEINNTEIVLENGKLIAKARQGKEA